jgi:hypothetical protein
MGPLIVCMLFAGGLHPVCGPSITENFLILSRPRERARTDPYGPRPQHQGIAFPTAQVTMRRGLAAGTARVLPCPSDENNADGSASIPILDAVWSSRAEDGLGKHHSPAPSAAFSSARGSIGSLSWWLQHTRPDDRSWKRRSRPLLRVEECGGETPWFITVFVSV